MWAGLGILGACYLAIGVPVYFLMRWITRRWLQRRYGQRLDLLDCGLSELSE